MWLCVAGTTAVYSAEPTANRFQFTQTEMAVPIKIVLYADENATASIAAEAAFARFHQLNSILSDYDPESELRKLCSSSTEGNPIRVSDDLWRVLVRADSLARQTDGAFDVTIGPLVRVWRNARRTKEIPSADSVANAQSLVGRRLMLLHPENQTVELLKPNMRIDLGGIAKGYAVDEAMAAIRKHGLTRMMVEAGGNIGFGNPPPDKTGWRVGIAPPDAQSPPREYIEIANAALSTSGDMWQYAIIGGVRYSHLVDPRTGVPLTHHYNVTVIGPSGLETDGLSSAIAILGPEKGLKLLDATPNTAAFIVSDRDGKTEIVTSENWAAGGKNWSHCDK